MKKVMIILAAVFLYIMMGFAYDYGYCYSWYYRKSVTAFFLTPFTATGGAEIWYGDPGATTYYGDLVTLRKLKATSPEITFEEYYDSDSCAELRCFIVVIWPVMLVMTYFLTLLGWLSIALFFLVCYIFWGCSYLFNSFIYLFF